MDFEDYTKATFPMDIKRPGIGNTGWVRLYGAMQDKVFGIIWYGETFETGYPSQAILWNGDGSYGDHKGHYPDMDLPPPPAHRSARIAELRADIANLQDRDTEELREMAAHVAGVLAFRDGCDKSAAVYHRIGDRLEALTKRESH